MRQATRAIDARRAATSIRDFATWSLAFGLASGSLLRFGGGLAMGTAVIAVALCVGLVARRAGADRRAAGLGAATLIASLPHAALDGPALLAAALWLLGLALRGPLRATFVGAGFLAMAMPLTGAPELTPWPWQCLPRRLGTAMPLAWAIAGFAGLTVALAPSRDPDSRPLATLLERVGPLAIGLTIVWLGTYHPPRPPLYNLPTSIAMAAGGIWIGALVATVARRERPQLVGWPLVGLGGAVIVTIGWRTEPLGPGPVCGQWLAPLGVLALLAVAQARGASWLRDRGGPVVDRAIDLVALAQILWLAGFTTRS